MVAGLHPHHELLQILDLLDQLIRALPLLNVPLQFLQAVLDVELRKPARRNSGVYK
jgi:hypothetical protein